MGSLSLSSALTLSLAPRSSGGGGTPTPTPSIGTPVITQTSTAGTAPFGWSVAEDATFMAGMYWDVQRATGTSTVNASANLAAGTLNGEAIQQITTGDLADTSTIVFADLTATPSGPLALRLRVGVEDGSGGYIWGSWSNVLTDTIVAIVALATSNGNDKSQYITTTGTPELTATMNNDLGAPCNVRATVSSNHKTHFEVTLNSYSSQTNNYCIGVSDASLVLGPAVYPRPGSAATSGFSINISHTSDAVNLYANGGYVGDSYMPSAPVAGDIIVIEYDPATNAVSLWHNRSGSNTAIGSVTLTSGIPTNWTATVAGNGSSGGTGADSMTCNFGGSAFVKTPSSGYTAYG